MIIKNNLYTKILFLILLGFFIFHENIFNYYLDFNYDIFEYILHINTLVNFGDLSFLKDLRFGTTGEFPIYSKFPGYFLNVANISLITGFEESYALVFYTIFVRLFFYVSIFLILKRIFIHKVLNKYSLYILIVLLFITLLPFTHLSTQLHNVYFFIIGSYFFIYFRKYLLGILLFYSMVIFHHQSLIILAPIVLLILCFGIYHDRSNYNKILLPTVIFLLILVFHIWYFIMPDIHNIMKMGNAVVGNDSFNNRLVFIIFPINFILTFLVAKSIGKYGGKYRILAYLVLSYLILFSVFPILFPERVYYLFLLFSLPFILLILIDKSTGYFVRLFLVLLFINNFYSLDYILKTSGFFKVGNNAQNLRNYILDYHLPNSGIFETLGYFSQVIEVKGIVKNECILGDIFLNFNFNNIGNIKSCYNFERPLNPLIYKEFELYKKYPLIESIYINYNDINLIREIFKENNVKYFVFNDKFIYYNSLNKESASLMRNIFIKLNELDDGIELIKKIKYKDSTFFIYKMY